MVGMDASLIVFSGTNEADLVIVSVSVGQSDRVQCDQCGRLGVSVSVGVFRVAGMTNLGGWCWATR